MKCFYTIICYFFISLPCYATDYFVDQTGGSDSNTGTSVSQAWQTIAKVNSEMGRFRAGDRIMFKRGEIWAPGNNQDGLTITCVGEPNNHIIFGSYGDGSKSKPVITFSGLNGDGRYSGADEVCIYLKNVCGYITIEYFSLNAAANNMAVEFTGVGTPVGPIYIYYCDLIGDGYEDEALMANNFPNDSKVSYCTFDTRRGRGYSKAIEVKVGERVVVSNNVITGFASGGGIRYSNGANHGIIERNLITHPLDDNAAFAICYRSADAGGVIRNNIIDLRGSTLGPKLLRGITGWLGSNGREVYNNTIIGEGFGSAFKIEDRNWKIKNNFVLNVHTVFNISDSGGVTAERNAHYNCNVYEDNDNIFNDLGGNITEDPGIGNLQIENVSDVIPREGSPLINSGINDDPDIPNNDYQKNEREAIDIGAFEYIEGMSIPKNLRKNNTNE